MKRKEYVKIDMEQYQNAVKNVRKLAKLVVLMAIMVGVFMLGRATTNKHVEYYISLPENSEYVKCNTKENGMSLNLSDGSKFYVDNMGEKYEYEN